jgi:hypothetical protein
MALFSLYAQLMGIFGTGPWALCWPRAGSAATTLRALQDMGAPPPLVVAVRPGAALAPELRVRDVVLVPVEPSAPDLYSEFLAWEQAMARVAPELLDPGDPERRAQVLAPTGTVIRSVGGRPVWGAEDLRLRHQIEDKVLVVDILEKCSLDLGPAWVGPLHDAGAAARSLDHGSGTVWAGDAAETIHGGGVGTRWVHDATSRAAAEHALGPPARRVRVMPFHRGVPCAIQGFCTPDGTAIFEPMEMVVLVEPTTGRFHFCGMATLWNPRPELRRSMREGARRVGEHLRTQLGWRGGFSVDGVAADGPSTARFVPTEINARFSGGLSRLDAIHGGPPLALAHRALWAGHALDLPATRLEQQLGGVARARRICGVFHATEQPPTREHSLALPHQATLSWRDGGGYGRVELNTDPLVRRPGPPVGPELAAALDRARAELGLPLPRMVSPAASD